MSKPIFLSIAILLSFSNIFAQNIPVTFGAKFGYSHSNLDLAEEIATYKGYGSTNNFHLGLVSEFELPKSFGVKAELLYSQKGGEAFFEFNFIDPNAEQKDEKLRFNFIALPVLLTYRFSAFQIEGGIETAFRQQTKLILEGNKLNLNSSEGRFDFGINGGINYVLHSAIIGIRYNHGFKAMPLDFTFTDDVGSPLATQPKFLNRVWQFSITYKI